jgi:hypothetical protein
MEKPIQYEWYVREDLSGIPAIDAFSDILCLHTNEDGVLIAEGPQLPNGKAVNFNRGELTTGRYKLLECPLHYAQELEERLIRKDPLRTINFIRSKLEQGSQIPSQTPTPSYEFGDDTFWGEDPILENEVLSPLSYDKLFQVDPRAL